MTGSSGAPACAERPGAARAGRPRIPAGARLARAALALWALAAAAGWDAAAADAPADPALYRATTIVTGSGEESRAQGIAATLETVLVKVSGNPNLVGDPRIAAHAPAAERFVTGVAYRDLYAGRQIHDEQGTYDRPHFMTVSFAADGIDGLLARLGERVHPDPRPEVTVALQVDARDAAFVLTPQTGIGRAADMRESFGNAAARVGLGIRFVEPSDELALAPGQIRRLARGAARRPPQTPAGGPVLIGNLVWDDRRGIWDCHWVLEGAGETQGWRIGGVSFDEAFRIGMRGTLGILSGKPLRLQEP